MKKVIWFILLLLVAVTLGSICAATTAGDFVGSPELKDEIYFIGAGTYLTEYKDKNQLSSEKQNELTVAYRSIIESGDIRMLSRELASLIEETKISIENFAVSDIFDISADFQSMSYSFYIGKKNMDNFFCLIHRVNGIWQVVTPLETVEYDGVEMIRVTVDTLSPFAFVVCENVEKQRARAFGYGIIITSLVAAGVWAGIGTKKYFKKKQQQQS